MRVVVFKLAEQEYLLEIEVLKEIVGADSIKRLPEPSGYVTGTIKRFGKVVPVLSLRQVLDLPPTGINVDSCVFIVKYNERLVGLIVDSVSEIINVDERAMEPPPSLPGGAGGVFSKYAKGATYLGERLLVLLDLRSVLTAQGRQSQAA